MPWPPPGRRLLPREAADYLYSVGWMEPLNLVKMIAVAQQEAQFYCQAVGPPNSNGSVDCGWLQINSQWMGTFGFDNLDAFKAAAFEPLTCAQFARHIWASAVKQNRSGFSPWVAYTSGDYKRFLGTALIGMDNMLAIRLGLEPTPYVERKP